MEIKKGLHLTNGHIIFWIIEIENGVSKLNNGFKCSSKNVSDCIEAGIWKVVNKEEICL